MLNVENGSKRRFHFRLIESTLGSGVTHDDGEREHANFTIEFNDGDELLQVQFGQCCFGCAQVFQWPDAFLLLDCTEAASDTTIARATNNGRGGKVPSNHALSPLLSVRSRHVRPDRSSGERKFRFCFSNKADCWMAQPLLESRARQMNSIDQL